MAIADATEPDGLVGHDAGLPPAGTLGVVADAERVKVTLGATVHAHDVIFEVASIKRPTTVRVVHDATLAMKGLTVR